MFRRFLAWLRRSDLRRWYTRNTQGRTSTCPWCEREVRWQLITDYGDHLDACFGARALEWEEESRARFDSEPLSGSI